MEFLKQVESIRTKSIISLVLIFTLFGIIASFVLDIINAIAILTTDWENEELNSDRTIWGILTLVVLGPIASLIFASKAKKVLSKNQTNSVETSTKESK